jgi:hypothetical protein
MAAQSVTLLPHTPYVMTGTSDNNGITYTYTVPATELSYAVPSIFRVSVQTTYQPGSGIAITVAQNGSTKYTMPTPGATQSASQFSYDLLSCAIGDVITVNLTSSTAIDALLNNMQTVCSIMGGL